MKTVFCSRVEFNMLNLLVGMYLLFSTPIVHAQIVSPYNIQVVSSGTVLNAASLAAESTILVRGRSSAPFYTNGFYTNIPIGFSFPLYGASHTMLNVFEAGYVSFGGIPGSSPSSPEQSRPLSASGGTGVISAFGFFLSPLTGDGVLFYRNAGVAPNRTFTIQWRRFYYNSNGGDGTSTQAQQLRLDFEIILSENGIVEIKYGDVSLGASFGTLPITLEVGMRASSSLQSLSFTNKDIFSSTLRWFPWSSAALSINSPQQMIFAPGDSRTSPAGTTFRFIPTGVTPPITLPPIITSLTDSARTVAATFRINGTNFSGVTAVRIGTVSVATYTVNSPTQITVTVPNSLSPGVYPVTVTTPVGTSNAVNLTVIPPSPPTITSLTPTSGAPGTDITLNVSNLVLTRNLLGEEGATVRITAGGVTSSSFVRLSSTGGMPFSGTIGIAVPAGTAAGAMTITVTGQNGTSEPAIFTVTAPPVPTITSFSPTSGMVGATVTITGTNFTGATAVSFGGVSTSVFTVNSAGTSITATVPTGAVSGGISITTPNGTARSSADFTVTVPVPPPIISSITPTSGVVGTSVSITGENLNTITSVLFGGIPATAFTILSPTSINATVPSGAITGRVVVVSGAMVRATSASIFTLRIPPVISGFTPEIGTSGSLVAVQGANFVNITSVRFGATAAIYTVISPTQINVNVPLRSGSAPISISSFGGSATSATLFRVIPPPSIAAFSPLIGAAGTELTLTGSGFTGTTLVRVGTVSAVYIVESDTRMRVIVPEGLPSFGTGFTVTVRTNAGTVISTQVFTPTRRPIIFGVNTISTAPGRTLLINGAQFVDVSSVRIGGVTATAFSVLSPSQISAIVPAGASNGAVSVTNSAGSTTSTFSLTIQPPPTITEISPLRARAGDLVIITGTNLLTPTAIRFGSETAIVRPGSNTSAVAVVPSTLTVSTPITVVTESGSATSSQVFTPYLPPVITSISPTTGREGTVITIRGQNFIAVGGGSVLVRDAANNSLGFFTASTVNPTELSITLPRSMTNGPITIYAEGGVVTSEQALVLDTSPLPPITTAPILLSPENGVSVAVGRSGASVVRWQRIPDIALYDVEFDVVNDFSTSYRSGFFRETTDSAQVAIPYASGITIYWRVRGRREDVLGPWSEVRSFRTARAIGIVDVIPGSLEQNRTTRLALSSTFEIDMRTATAVRISHGSRVVIGSIDRTRTRQDTLFADFAVPADAQVGLYDVSVEIGSMTPTVRTEIVSVVAAGDPPLVSAFRPEVSGFSFPNGEAFVWPPSYYADYSQAPYNTWQPEFQTLATRNTPRNSFPRWDDWASAVELYTPAYIGTGADRRPTLQAIQSWYTWRFPGSCFGFTSVALLHHAGLYNRGGATPYGLSTPSFSTNVSHDVLKLIHVHQLSQWARDLAATPPPSIQSITRGERPNQTVQRIRAAFLSGNRAEHPGLAIATPSGGHAVVPYALSSGRNALGEAVDSLFVYDPNNVPFPGYTPRVVVVNRARNTYDFYGGTFDYGLLVTETPSTLPQISLEQFPTRPIKALAALQADSTPRAAQPSRMTVNFSTPEGNQPQPFVSVSRNLFGVPVSVSTLDAGKPFITYPDARVVQPPGGCPTCSFLPVNGFSLPFDNSAQLRFHYTPTEQQQAAQNPLTLSLYNGARFTASVSWVPGSNRASLQAFADVGKGVFRIISPVALENVELVLGFRDPSLQAWENIIRIQGLTLAADDSLQVAWDANGLVPIITTYNSRVQYRLALIRGNNSFDAGLVQQNAQTSHQYNVERWSRLQTSGVSRTETNLANGNTSVTVLRQPTSVAERQQQTSRNTIANLQHLDVYPNPAADKAALEFTLNATSFTVVTVVNILGQSVMNVLEEMREAGRHTLSLNTANLPNGAYICRIKTQTGERSLLMQVFR